jgi:hypothetical protein
MNGRRISDATGVGAVTLRFDLFGEFGDVKEATDPFS